MAESYNKCLLTKLQAGLHLLKDIKCVMIQSTGVSGDFAASYYDKLDTEPNKKIGHIVIGSADVVHYDYADSSVFVDGVTFTDAAKTLLVDKAVAGDAPTNHIYVVEICINNTSYADIELNAIKTIAQFLKTYGLTSSNLWRRSELINDSTPNTTQYNTAQMWSKFLLAIDEGMKQLNTGAPDWTKVTGSGVDLANPGVFEKDPRTVKLISTKIEISKIVDSDFEITTTADVTTKKDKFTGQITTAGGTKVYEPIYPDLTVPPRAATNLYNEQVKNVKDLKSKTKPILGKPVNNTDPYPIDNKIIELELHYPIVKIDDDALNAMQGSSSAVATYLMALSDRAEKRIIQLENVLSTMMRYTFRLGCRMNINCVYYGGQTTFGKYNCIRCLQDDLINDGQMVTMDQCLNCSRYEPIIGQVYDILSEDGKLNLDSAVIQDDNQMARMTMDDYIKLSRVEEFIDDDEDAENDKKKLAEKDPDDKTLNELAQNNDSFVMQWVDTPLVQMPDINEYTYDQKKILEEKDKRLKPEVKYYDGYKDVVKKKIDIPVNKYGLLSGSGGTGAIGSFNGGYGTIDDYDWTGAEKLKAIVETAIKLGEFGKAAKAGYVYGGKVIAAYMSKSPDELYSLLMGGTQPMLKCSTDGTPIRTDALGFDCSGLASYCYTHNGVELSGGATSELNSYCTPVGKPGDLADNLSKAVPGDLCFFGSSASDISHVVVYVGGGEYVGADTANAETNNQVRRKKVYKENFYCIARHKGITALPKLKSVRYYAVNMSLQEAAQKEYDAGATGASGGDHAGTTVDEVKQYVDPSSHLGGSSKYQFFNLGAPNGLTADQVKSILQAHGATQALIDNADAFIEAAKTHNISEAYLVAHCGLETGWGSSGLANGSMTGPSSGRAIYDMYGIAAFNSDSSRAQARQYSEDHGWFTTRDGIIGGAQFVAEGYIAKGQNTLYKMRYNLPSASHQYATDVGWANKQCSTIAKTLDAMSEDIKAKYMFEIPQFNG